MTGWRIGRLTFDSIGPGPRTCGIHGDDTTDGRCATCDDHGANCDGPLNCTCEPGGLFDVSAAVSS